MKIVKFKNGKYAIRRWFFGFEYLSRTEPYWWLSLNGAMNYATFNTLEGCQKRMDDYKKGIDFGVVVK